MTDATAAPIAPVAHTPVDKNVTTESPTSVIGTHDTKSPPSPTPVPEDHAHAATTHPASAQVKTMDAPPSPASSKNSLTSSMKTDGGGSMDRDAALAKVQHEKTMSHIRAWEEGRKAKAINRCSAQIAKIGAWESAQKAAAESRLKQAEEKLEKKRAALVEKMRNQIAATHKAAEEKRALAEARKGEDIFKIEEESAKYKASTKMPGGFLCFKA